MSQRPVHRFHALLDAAKHPEMTRWLIEEAARRQQGQPARVLGVDASTPPPCLRTS